MVAVGIAGSRAERTARRVAVGPVRTSKVIGTSIDESVIIGGRVTIICPEMSILREFTCKAVCVQSASSPLRLRAIY